MHYFSQKNALKSIMNYKLKIYTLFCLGKIYYNFILLKIEWVNQ